MNNSNSHESRPVTVVTITKNRDDLLIRCIKSVCNQDYNGFIEHVIVSDNSDFVTNNERDLLTTFPRIKIIHANLELKKSDYIQFYIPSRISYLRNIGIANSIGEYICHLGDDDYYLNNHVSSLVRTIESDPQAGVAYSWRYLNYSDGTPCTEPFYPWSSAYPRLSTDGEELSKYVYTQLVSSGIRAIGSNIVKDTVLTDTGERVYTVDTNELMVKREVHKAFPFRVLFTWRQMIEDYSEDYCFVKECFEGGIKFVCSNEISLIYTIGGASNNQNRRLHEVR